MVPQLIEFSGQFLIFVSCKSVEEHMKLLRAQAQEEMKESAKKKQKVIHCTEEDVFCPTNRGEECALSVPCEAHHSDL